MLSTTLKALAKALLRIAKRKAQNAFPFRHIRNSKRSMFVLYTVLVSILVWWKTVAIIAPTRHFMLLAMLQSGRSSPWFVTTSGGCKSWKLAITNLCPTWRQVIGAIDRNLSCYGKIFTTVTGDMADTNTLLRKDLPVNPIKTRSATK